MASFTLYLQKNNDLNFGCTCFKNVFVLFNMDFHRKKYCIRIKFVVSIFFLEIFYIKVKKQKRARAHLHCFCVVRNERYAMCWHTPECTKNGACIISGISLHYNAHYALSWVTHHYIACLLARCVGVLFGINGFALPQCM